MKKLPVQKLIVTSVLGAFLLQSVGCGYLLYPERKGQKSGEIDPAVAIMDGLGLLLYIVPGVIAFAVDYTNGTIYLPSGGKGGKKGADADSPAVEIQVANKEDLRDKEKLEALISKELEQPVDLDASNIRVQLYDAGTDAVHLVQYANWQVQNAQFAAR